jgi:hypothetical protein
MIESDFHYFQRRAGEERLAAERAMCAEARRAHLELASRYAEVAETIGRTVRTFEATFAGRSLGAMATRSRVS